MSEIVLGVVVNDIVDVERRDVMEIPVVDEAEDVCGTSEVGTENATWEVGAPACVCTVADRAEVTGDGSGALLDVEEGLAVLALGTGAVRVGLGFWSSDGAAGGTG